MELAKKSFPPTSVNSDGLELPVPGLMSILVAIVPSYFHSSWSVPS